MAGSAKVFLCKQEMMNCYARALLWCDCDWQAVYGVLKEAEHRSTFYIPYWNIPITKYIVPRQRKFNADLAVINACLDDLIAQAKQTRQADDVEALQARDYSKVRIASFLAACATVILRVALAV